MADDLRVPVSNIVRTVLEEAFSVVEKVTDDVGDLIEEVVDEAEAARDRIRRRHRHRRRRHHRRSARHPAEADAAKEDVQVREPPAAEVSEPLAAVDEVIGWQPLFLAQSRDCAECETQLERGSQAYAAVTGGGMGSAVLCESCVGAQRRG